MIPRRLPEIVFKLGVVGFSIWVLATAVSVLPDERGLGTHEKLDMEPCGYLERTGRPCMTCGMTTSFAHTVRFQLIGAFRASPAGMVLCLLTIMTPAWTLHSLLTGAPLLRFLRGRGWWCLPALAVIVFASWWYKIAAMAE